MFSGFQTFILSVALFIAIPPLAFSQNTAETVKNAVNGTIADDAGPVIGASVIVKGTMNGCVTGPDGSFSLSDVKPDDVLVISMIGYHTQEIVYTGQISLEIFLEESNEYLKESVVTALGIRRSEKALSYNVQQVEADALMAVRDANFISSLNGKVAGVTFNSATSAGGASRVVMRGVKSITSSNLALYVIDGVPMYNSIAGGGDSIFSDQPGTDFVADINPDDIEYITMLTGPSAAALYGNAAAAGVVMITTKKGKAGKVSLTYSNNTTFSTAYMMPQTQSRYGNQPNILNSWGAPIESDYNPRDFFRTGVNEMNTLSMTAGNNRNQTYLSAASTNSSNIIPNSGYSRYNFTLRNTTSFLNEKMTLDIGANYILQNDKNMVAQGFYYNPLPAIYRFPRSENFDDVRMYERYNPLYGINEEFWPYGGKASEGLSNPYWIQNRQIRENKKTRYMINASLKYQILDWLDISGRVKVDNSGNRYTRKEYANTGDPALGAGKGAYMDIYSESKNTYADVIATANKVWDNWSVNVNIGASINDSNYESIGYDGGLKEYNFFAVHNIDFNKSWKAKQSGWHDQTQAVFASAEVGYGDMLYLTMTGRNDWDSRLAFSDYKSFFYPSVGLSAVISNMFDAPQWLSLLKVRASYTEVGNSYDRFMTTITYPYNEQSASWSTSTTYPNTKLKPERTKSWEIGLDANFFSSLSIGLTYYRSNTFNQTFHATLPASSGYTSIPIQSGNILNEGIEMALGYDNSWGDFSFGAHYTLTWNRNEVIRLADGVINPYTEEPIEMKELEVCSYGPLDSKLVLRPGGSMGDVYAYKFLARDKNGYIANDLKTVTVGYEDKVYLGSIFPAGNMGLALNLGWRGLNLGATLNARIGGIVMSATQSILNAAGVSEESAVARDNGGIPINGFMADAQAYYETINGAAYYYTYSATNVRLGELTLNYSFPRRWFKEKMGLTIGLVGKNLAMIYCKAPFDPELTTAAGSNFYQGFDAYMLPSTRNWGFNLKLQF